MRQVRSQASGELACARLCHLQLLKFMCSTEANCSGVEAAKTRAPVDGATVDGWPQMTLAEVAKKTGYTPAATRRSLFTLARLGYVRQSGRNFMLAPKILLLSSAYLRSAHVEDALLPVLHDVVERFGDEASVAVLSGDRILYVAHAVDPRKLRPFAGTGVTQPAYLTSMGYVLLGTLDGKQFKKYLDELVMAPVTDATLTSKKAFAETVEKVRRERFAVAVDQIAYGVTAIAVPISLKSGGIVAALNSSGYTGRLDSEELLEKRLPYLKEAAAKVAEILEVYPVLKETLLNGGPLG